MTYGISISQLRCDIVRPALRVVGLWSAPAENLVLGTALVESRAKYVRQLGGPALGLWQMEPATHDDIWAHYLRYQRELRERVRRLGEDSDRLVYDLWYGAVMCRVHYRRAPGALPLTALGAAQYWKQHYNTHLGAGTVEKAVPHFEAAFA